MSAAKAADPKAADPKATDAKAVIAAAASADRKTLDHVTTTQNDPVAALKVQANIKKGKKLKHVDKAPTGEVSAQAKKDFKEERDKAKAAAAPKKN